MLARPMLTLAVVAAAAVVDGQTPPSPPRTYANNPVDTAHGEREFLRLWPQGAPGAVGDEPPDQPKLTVYRAPAERATGAAVVILPGGGYRTLASDHEGRRVAEWLNTLGVSAFVVQYRVGPRYRHPAPLQDAQRALRLVRSRAAEWGVDPARVGILGFSAGGHLAATTGTYFDEGDPAAADPVERMGSRPDFMVLAYPVISLTAPFAHKGSRDHLLGPAPDPTLLDSLSGERAVTSRTPPAFLFHTSDDASVPVANSLAFYEALRAAGVPAELHVFPRGRHGLGLAPEDPVVSRWPELAAAWLRTMGMLDRRVSAGAPTPGALEAWRYSKVIRLDTTAAGADVAGDVRSFPLALRLDASHLDFSQAKWGGADLRFTRTSDGAPLPFAVEHWDRHAQRAAVWVKLDVVKGNDARQSFVMHWGNPDAPDARDSHAVFDTREGWLGVWHLGEEGGTRDGYQRDATAHEAHATGIHLLPGATADGRIGKALPLEHARGQWVALENDKRRLFDVTTRATFSIWAKARGYFNQGVDGKLPGYETLFAKGDNSWRLQKFGIRDWHKPPADLVEICVEGSSPKADLCVVGKTDIVPGRWFHFTGVHDFPKVKLYVNGALEAVETFDVNWVAGDHPVGIGNQSQFPAQGRRWDGVLDEARVLNVAKDGHWIKLDYESQREGSKLRVFGETKDRRAPR